MPRKQGAGSQYKGAMRAEHASGGGEWKADYSGTTLQTASDLSGTYSTRSFNYRTLLAAGLVSRFLQATGKSYADILATEIMGLMDDFTAQLEAGLVMGTGTGSEPAGFAQTVLDDVATFAQETQCASSSSVAALSLSKLDEAIDSVKGSSNRSDLVIVLSHKMGRILNGLCDDNLTYLDNQVMVDAGFRVKTYDGVPVITSTAMLDTGTLSGGGACTALIGGAAGSILILNKRYCWIEELTPTTIMPIARTSSQVETFELFWDGAAVVANPYGAALVTGINMA